MSWIAKLTPPLLYQSCIVAMLVFHFLLPIRQVVMAPYRYGGIILFLGGAGFAIWAKRIFKQSGIPIRPSQAPVRVYTEGPFGMSRNPMYLGISIGLLGIAVILGSLVTFVFPVVFAAVMNFVYIPFEERMLESALPTDYRRYKERVRRWL